MHLLYKILECDNSDFFTATHAYTITVRMGDYRQLLKYIKLSNGKVATLFVFCFFFFFHFFFSTLFKYDIFFCTMLNH